MASSSVLGRAGRMRILWTTVLAIAAAALFLAPTAVFSSSGSRDLVLVSSSGNAPALAPVTPHGSTSGLDGPAPASGRSSDGTLHLEESSSRLQRTALAGASAETSAMRNPPAAGSVPRTGVADLTHTTDVAALPVGGVTAGIAGATEATTFIAGWNGINGTQSQCDCSPPDPSIAAGPTALVEVTNGQFYFYGYNSAVLDNVSADNFWGAGTDFINTPYILYDNLTDRWITSAMDVTANTFMVGVSVTSDPLGYWEEYEGIPIPPDEEGDFPTLGVSEFMVGVALTDYNTTTEEYESNLWVFNYTNMQSGISANYTYFNSEDGYAGYYPNFYATQGLTESASQYFALVNPYGVYVVLNVTDAPPAATSYTISTFYPTGASAAPEDADQYGTEDTIYGGTAQAIDSSYQQNGLVSAVWDAWNATYEVDSVRLDQGWPSNSTLWQDDTFWSDDGIDLIFPAMAIDSRGDLTFIAGYSNDENYPGLFAWGQAAGEPYSYAAVYGVPVFGTTYTTNFFWGDYFSGAAEPNSSEVWFAGEYMGSDPSWNTWIFGAQTDPVTVDLTSTPVAATDVGLPVTFNATAYGGVGYYSYNWTSLPPGCTNSEAAGVACAPTTAGTYTVSVNASDAYPQNASASISFTVNPLPTLAVPTASKPAADVGQTVTFTSATPVGGTPGFTYAWTGLPSGCGSSTASSVQCIFTAAATLTLGDSATDAVGSVATSPALTYTVSPALTVGTPTATPSSGATGSTFTFAVTATGGSGGDSYAWTGLPTGCTSSDAASITCAPSGTGTFTVGVTVTDSNGASATSGTVSVTVTAAPVGLFGLPGSDGLILLAVIVVVVVALIAVLLARRRKPAASPPPAWQPGTGAPPPGASGGNVPPGAGGSPPPPS